MSRHIEEFMKQLQEDDGKTTFSTPPEDNISAIPPDAKTEKITVERSDSGLKVIAPQSDVKIQKPAFRIKKQQPEPQVIIIDEPPKVIEPEVKHPVIEQPVIEQPVIERPRVEQPRVENQPPSVKNVKTQQAEELFIRSETPLQMKSVWLEQYEKAVNSKKENYVVDKMRRGRFCIDTDGKIQILPDIDIYGKSSNDLLSEKWL